MTTAEDAFEPAEKEFHGPAITVAQRDQFGREVEPTGCQQEDVRPTLGVGLAGIDFDNADGLLEGTAALGAAEPHDAIAANAGGTCLVCEWTFFDDGPDRIV